MSVSSSGTVTCCARIGARRGADVDEERRGLLPLRAEDELALPGLGGEHLAELGLQTLRSSTRTSVRGTFCGLSMMTFGKVLAELGEPRMREVATVETARVGGLHLRLAELEPRVPGRALLLVTEREVDERPERVVLLVGRLELGARLAEAALLHELLAPRERDAPRRPRASAPTPKRGSRSRERRRRPRRPVLASAPPFPPTRSSLPRVHLPSRLRGRPTGSGVAPGGLRGGVPDAPVVRGGAEPTASSRSTATARPKATR